MNIYTGNIPTDVTEDDLRKEFQVFGQVTFVNVVKDRFGKTSRGFGYLGMPVQSEAEAAISGLNGKEFRGKPLIVAEARPRALSTEPIGTES